MNHLPSSIFQSRDVFAARFSPPRVRAVGPCTTPGAESAAAPLPKSVSPELTRLMAPAMPPPASIPFAPLRRTAVARSPWSELTDRMWDEDEIRRLASRGGVFSVIGGRGQSSGQSGEEDESQGQTPAPRHALAVGERVLQRADESSMLANDSHMSGTAATLARRCAEHRLSHGDSAMLPFLRQAVIELLPAFVRDLGNKLHALDIDRQAEISSETIRPVAEVCDEFIGLLRPLYGRYVSGPHLLADARQALCTAQAMLTEEVAGWSDRGSQLERVMHDTVNPLFAILVMSCIKPPASDAAFFETVRHAREDLA